MAVKPKDGASKRTQVGWSLVVLVWLPMAALLVWGKGGVLDLIALRKEVKVLQVEVSKLEEENARIRAEIQRLQTDPTAYEALARERFFLKKPGEKVLYLGPDGASEKPPEALPTAAQPAKAAAAEPATPPALTAPPQ